MGNFDLSNYVEVNVRVEKFWELYPHGRIITKIVSFENGTIVMKASIYKDAEDLRPDATGHAYEKENGSFINKTSAIENCETSAVGRALGIMGFEIKKSIASKEEVANAVHQNNSQTKAKDPDAELKRDLMAQFKGDKAAAKKEYDKIVKSRGEELDPEAVKYMEEKFELEGVKS
jgi:hypothetical protein